jgi:hypothetical protein
MLKLVAIITIIPLKRLELPHCCFDVVHHYHRFDYQFLVCPTIIRYSSYDRTRPRVQILLFSLLECFQYHTLLPLRHVPSTFTRISQYVYRHVFILPKSCTKFVYDHIFVSSKANHPDHIWIKTPDAMPVADCIKERNAGAVSSLCAP